jgi:membrane protease YdiL (CAAX protease family)
LISRQREIILGVSFPLLAAALLNGLWIEYLYHSNPAYFWAADISEFVLFPALGVAVLGLLGGIWPHQYGIRQLPRGYSPAELFGLFALVMFMYWLFYSPIREFTQQFLWKSEAAFGYKSVIPPDGVLKILAVGYFSLTAAFLEEVLFRGLPWLYLSLRFPNGGFTGTYILSTSLLFAMIHWEQGPAGVIAAFTLGLIAATMYSKLQNLWPFIVAHFVADVVAFS